MWMLDLQLGLARAWADAANTWWKAGADAMSVASRGVGVPTSTPLSWPASMLQPFSQPAFNPVQALSAFTPVAFMFPASGRSPWILSGLPGSWTWTPSAPWPAVAWSFAGPWPTPVSPPSNPLLEMSKLVLPLMALPAAWASAMSSGTKAAPMLGVEGQTRASSTPATPASSYRSAGGHAAAAVIATPFDVARTMSAFWSFEPMSGRKPH